jgi:hypothetical protein
MVKEYEPKSKKQKSTTKQKQRNRKSSIINKTPETSSCTEGAGDDGPNIVKSTIQSAKPTIFVRAIFLGVEGNDQGQFTWKLPSKISSKIANYPGLEFLRSMVAQASEEDRKQFNCAKTSEALEIFSGVESLIQFKMHYTRNSVDYYPLNSLFDFTDAMTELCNNPVKDAVGLIHTIIIPRIIILPAVLSS